jgi:hypothetical protein
MGLFFSAPTRKNACMDKNSVRGRRWGLWILAALALFAAGCLALTTEPVREWLPRDWDNQIQMYRSQLLNRLYSETLWIRDALPRWAWPF